MNQSKYFRQKQITVTVLTEEGREVREAIDVIRERRDQQRRQDSDLSSSRRINFWMLCFVVPIAVINIALVGTGYVDVENPLYAKLMVGSMFLTVVVGLFVGFKLDARQRKLLVDTTRQQAQEEVQALLAQHPTLEEECDNAREWGDSMTPGLMKAFIEITSW